MERETGIEPATSSLGIFPSMDARSSRKGAKGHEYWRFPTVRTPCHFLHPLAIFRNRLRFVDVFVDVADWPIGAPADNVAALSRNAPCRHENADTTLTRSPKHEANWLHQKLPPAQIATHEISAPK